MRPIIFLFDIDGTLVDAAGAGRRALTASFAEKVGRTDGITQVQFCGRTDRGIVREGLRRSGLADDPQVVAAILEGYVARLPSALLEAPTFRALEGVCDALKVAASVGTVGIGTGNIAVGARCKLEPLGLMPMFRFGGYGCDAEDRAELLRIGARRGAALTGAALEDCAVRVIGDTPLDIAAARAIGASCLAVATGRYSRADLGRHEPDVLVDTLADSTALAFLRASTSPVPHR